MTAERKTQSQIAREMNVKRHHVHRWLAGKSMPNDRNLQALADAMGVDKTTLLIILYQKHSQTPRKRY